MPTSSVHQSFQQLKYVFLEYMVIAAVLVLLSLVFKYYLSRFLDRKFPKKQRKLKDSRSGLDQFLSENPLKSEIDPNVVRFLSKNRVKQEIKEDVKLNRWTLLLLQEIEWRRFEEVCDFYFNLKGYNTVLNNFGSDGGVDIRISKNNHLLAFVQCKSYKNKPVGVNVIREFVGVLTVNRVDYGFVITSSFFSSDAISYAKTIKSNTNFQLELIDGNEFLKHIFYLSDYEQRQLLDFALKGDYKTPTCVRCGIKMVRRSSKSNGNEFWGCRNYPSCRQILH
jgi:restriction system protein